MSMCMHVCVCVRGCLCEGVSALRVCEGVGVCVCMHVCVRVMA